MITDVGDGRPGVQVEAALEKRDARVAEFDVSAKSPLRKLQHFLHANPTAVPAIVLLLAVAAFSLIVGSRFLSAFNLSLIIQQVTIIGVIGIAQTLIVITAGIDLSVGAIMVLCSVIMGKLAVMVGLPAPIALIVGIAAGAGCGAVNGVLVTRLKLPPFIVTLGTLNIFFALNLWYSHSETIRAQDIEATAPLLQAFGGTYARTEGLAERIAACTGRETALVGELDGRMVGFAFVEVRIAIGDASPRAELTDLFVLEAYRRRGIGRLLVSAAETHAKARGAETLFLLTGMGNDRAQAFYRAVGYTGYSLALRRSLSLRTE